MFQLTKERIKKSINVRVLEYVFEHYQISVEEDLLGELTTTYEIKNLVEPNIRVVMLPGEEPMICIDYFISGDTKEISALVEELESGKRLLQELPQLEKEIREKLK